jgi:hypothetical protein
MPHTSGASGGGDPVSLVPKARDLFFREYGAYDPIASFLEIHGWEQDVELPAPGSMLICCGPESGGRLTRPLTKTTDEIVGVWDPAGTRDITDVQRRVC